MSENIETTKKYRRKVKQFDDKVEELRLRNIDLKVAEEKIEAQRITINELQAELDKIYKEGSLFFSENKDGYIVDATEVYPYMDRTWLGQEIDLKEIHTKAYQLFPYYKRTKEGIKIDKEQYKKNRRLLTI